GRLPGSPGHRRCLRRPGGPGPPACPRQGQPGPPRRAGAAGRPAVAAAGGPLPLAGGGPGEPAPGPGGVRLDRRRPGDGPAAPALPRLGTPVPPGVGADAPRRVDPVPVPEPGAGGVVLMLVELLHRVIEGHDLTAGEAERAMVEIMAGNATPAQIAGYLVALRIKGETVDEIIGSARAMRAFATPVVSRRRDLVDTCGTGG